MSLHRFEQAVRTVHDHLYANANIRTPEELQNEVAKILLALAWGRQRGVVPKLSVRDADDLRLGRGFAPQLAAAEVREIFRQYSEAHPTAAMEPIALDDASTAFVRALFDPFTFEGAERDWLGDALEVFRSTAAKRLGGQFFTDQRVTELAMRLLEFRPEQHSLVDICAGTGGFLIAGQKCARSAGVENPRIFGIEVDPKLAHLGNSTIPHFGGSANATVYCADSLRTGLEWETPLRKQVIEGTHDRLASNPPFGINITVKDPNLLGRYSLAHGWSKDSEARWQPTKRLTPRSPDILFMERNLQLAEPGKGRIALVTPYQILSGPKLGYVREWLLRHARLVAVVDLPEDTFQPWTGTKTSLVVYERREEPLAQWHPEIDDYPIFMAVARHIGHDRRGKPVEDEHGEIKTDLPAIGSAFEAWRRGGEPLEHHPEAFAVSSSDIQPSSDLRINASYHKPGARGARAQLASDEASEFDVVPLGQLVRRIFCPGRFRRNYVAGPGEGILFLGGSNITQVVTTNRKYLAKDDRHLAEMQVEEGWVLVTRSGSTGIVSSVPGPWSGLAMSEHVIRIIPDEEKLPAGYIEAYLRSDLGQRLLAAGVFGSVIDEITPEYIAKMPCPVPRDRSIVERVALAHGQANEARGRAISLIDDALALVDGFHGQYVD